MHRQTITSTPSIEFGAAADDDRRGTATQLGEWFLAAFSLPVFRYLATSKHSFSSSASDSKLWSALASSSNLRDYEAYLDIYRQQEHREGCGHGVSAPRYVFMLKTEAVIADSV